MRLQKFLAQAGVSSRRKAEALIASGAVRVNGVAVTELGTSVNASKDRVDVDGRRVVPETPIYRLLLKPRACLATLAKSGAGRPTLARYVRDAEPGLLVVAPLDFPVRGGHVADHRRRAGAGDGEAGPRADDVSPQAAGDGR